MVLSRSQIPYPRFCYNRHDTCSSAYPRAQSVTLLLWFFGYGWSVGPLPFVICAEVGSAQLRQKTISIARDTYYCLVVINSVAGPYLFNPTAANLKGKAAFLPFSFILALIVWSYFRLPETKGRSFEDLDIMFGKSCTALHLFPPDSVTPAPSGMLKDLSF